MGMVPHRSAPVASMTTSSSLSDNRVIRAPTIFLPCNSLRVDGSFWIRFETATQAHLRSAESGLSIWSPDCKVRQCDQNVFDTVEPFVLLARLLHFSTTTKLLMPGLWVNVSQVHALGCAVSWLVSSVLFPSCIGSLGRRETIARFDRSILRDHVTTN